jgi:hypothetical protein
MAFFTSTVDVHDIKQMKKKYTLLCGTHAWLSAATLIQLAEKGGTSHQPGVSTDSAHERR